MRILISLLLILALPCAALGQDSKEASPPPTAKSAQVEKATSAKADPALAAIDAFIAQAKIDKTKPNWKSNLPKPQAVAFNPKSKYFVRMITNKGPILIKFMPDVAPMHVTSFIYLTRLGFYDGVAFHRVIPGFMAQGGDPTGTGSGGPGYTYASEFKADVRHDKPGILSMANTGQPSSDGSQFFITFKPTPHLDDKHTVFGEVVDGMETLKKLEAAGSRNGATSEPLKMERVTIEVK